MRFFRTNHQMNKFNIENQSHHIYVLCLTLNASIPHILPLSLVAHAYIDAAQCMFIRSTNRTDDTEPILIYYKMRRLFVRRPHNLFFSNLSIYMYMRNFSHNTQRKPCFNTVSTCQTGVRAIQPSTKNYLSEK